MHPQDHNMPHWVIVVLDKLGITYIPDFVLVLINSMYGYRPPLRNSESEASDFQPLLMNQASSSSTHGTATMMVRPSIRQIRQVSNNLYTILPKGLPLRQFRLGHENCYNCIRGVCNFRRRRRTRIPLKATSYYGRHKQFTDDMIDDGYEADDEWEPPIFIEKTNLSSSDSDDEDDDDIQGPSGYPKVAERVGNCTYYHGYGG